MPGDPKRAFASMGNYIFTAEVLRRAVVSDAEDLDSAHDILAMDYRHVDAVIRQLAGGNLGPDSLVRPERSGQSAVGHSQSGRDHLFIAID